MRAPPSARISPRRTAGSRRGALIPLDEAASAGGFQAGAELDRVRLRREGTDHGAVVGALGAELDLVHEHAATAEHAAVFALQSAVGRLRLGLAPLRGDL